MFLKFGQESAENKDEDTCVLYVGFVFNNLTIVAFRSTVGGISVLCFATALNLLKQKKDQRNS